MLRICPPDSIKGESPLRVDMLTNQITLRDPVTSNLSSRTNPGPNNCVSPSPRTFSFDKIFQPTDSLVRLLTKNTYSLLWIDFGFIHFVFLFRTDLHGLPTYRNCSIDYYCLLLSTLHVTLPSVTLPSACYSPLCMLLSPLHVTLPSACLKIKQMMVAFVL